MLADMGLGPAPAQNHRIAWECAKCATRYGPEDEQPATHADATYAGRPLCRRCVARIASLEPLSERSPHPEPFFAYDEPAAQPVSEKEERMPTTKTRASPSRMAETWRCPEHDFASDWPASIAKHKKRFHGDENPVPAAPAAPANVPLAPPEVQRDVTRSPDHAEDGWAGIAADALYLHARVVMERLDAAIRDRQRARWATAARDLAALAQGLGVIAEAEER